jgi:hypothetical protein
MWAAEGLSMTFRKGEMGAFDDADSGEEDGEESVMAGEPNVEFVLVGDDSVEAEVIELMLSRW